MIRTWWMLIGAAGCLMAGSTKPCGEERWPVKVLSDPGATQIQSTPVAATILSLGSLPVPPGLKQSSSAIQNTRLSAEEKTIYTIEGTLTGYVMEADHDVHMVISDGNGSTMIAEMPGFDCLADTKVFKQDIQNARRVFTSRYPAITGFKQVSGGVKVRVTGVGFFDYIHAVRQNGIAPNGFELHPVTAFSFLDQCTPTDYRQSPLSLASVNGLDLTPWPPERRQQPVTQLTSLQDTARLVFAGYKIDPIFISKVLGSNTYIVTIAGTQLENIQISLNDAKNAGSASDAQNRVVPALLQALGLDDQYLRLVRAAIEGFPIPQGANVVLVGHSLGGYVAQKMIVLADHPFQRRWQGSAITFGSPAKFIIASGSAVTRYVLRDSRADDAVVAWCHNTPSIAMVLGIAPGAIAYVPMTFVSVTNGPVDPWGLGLHLYYPNAPELGRFPPLGAAYGQTVQLDTHQQAWCGSGAAFLKTTGRIRTR